MYFLIILLHIISSFRHGRYLPLRYAYVSIESIDCILLSSFELKGILLISSVKILSFSLLNLCCVLILVYCFYECFVYEYKFTIENKKTENNSPGI